MRTQRITYSSIAFVFVTAMTGACLEGRGSGLTGTSGGNGPGGATASVLTFFAPPGGGNAGQVMSAVIVVARDSLGRVNEALSGGITVALASNSTGAALSGTRTVRASRGTATFGNLSVDKPGTYTLQASASGAESVTSSPFVITSTAGP